MISDFFLVNHVFPGRRQGSLSVTGGGLGGFSGAPAGRLGEDEGVPMTPDGASLAVAVPAAIAGAACMGLASAAQAKATKQVPASKTLHPGLLVDLARRPLWLIGIGATIAGLGLQIVALGYGPLLLVQPLLVTALPFASGFSAWLGHRKADRPDHAHRVQRPVRERLRDPHPQLAGDHLHQPGRHPVEHPGGQREPDHPGRSRQQ